MSYPHAEDIDYNISAEPEAAYQINRELNLARRIVEETGANLFLTGKAGTGKTTFLRHLSETSEKRMVILAPTGVAAINAGGMTLHSFFQLPFAPFIPGRGFLTQDRNFYRITKEKRRLIASLDLLVIDEISMVRPDILDGIDNILRRLRSSNEPFGGLQLLLIGDIRQLSPVVKDNERKILEEFYPSSYFFDSLALRQAGFVTIELQTIYRQQDPLFISLLNSVRDGIAGRHELLTLNRLCYHEDYDNENIIRLTTHNHIADRINSSHLAMLPGELAVYPAGISGKFPESSYPAEKELSLKEGARVMFIKNDTGIARRYYNGMLGTVIRLSDESVTVIPDDKPDTPIEIGYVEWENMGYTIDETTKKVIQTVDGIFSQIPLRLAWSITIHKSQGLTFERAVIDASHSFAPGQLYVALSRCRSLAGLRLESPLTPESVIIDHAVNRFIDDSRKNAPDATMLSALRNEYCRRLLADLFNFHALGIAFRDFAHNVREFVAPIHPYLFSEYDTAENLFSDKIEKIGDRFISLYASSPIDPDEIATNSQLQEKIASGCRYFLEQLGTICRILNHTPHDLSNQSYSRRLANTTDLLSFHIKVKKAILTSFQSASFTPSTYLEIKSAAILAVSNCGASEASTKSSPRNKKEPKIPKLKKPKGYSIYETLAIFRETGSIEATASRRNLTEGTIITHLAQLITKGDLALADLLSTDTIATLTTTASSYSPTSTETLFAFLCRNHPSLPCRDIALFTRSLPR